MYQWRSGYVQRREKVLRLRAKWRIAPAHPSMRSYTELLVLLKAVSRVAPYTFLRYCEVLSAFEGLGRFARWLSAFRRYEMPSASIGRAFASSLRAQKWAPYTLLYRDVNASAAEVAEVPSEREVICDSFAVLYRGVGGLLGAKMCRKRELKELCLQIALLLITRFE